MIQAQTNIVADLMQAPAETVRLWRDPIAFAAFLVELKGSTFIAYHSEIPEKGLRMLKKHRDDKTPNPFIGSGIRKVTDAQASINFDYEKKREKRGGDAPETHGTWHTRVMVDGKPTPLAVHKGDVVTELAEGATKDILKNRRAVLDDNGNVQFTTDEPRLYMLYEYQRDGGDAPRSERKMRSASRYVLPNGDEVDKDVLAPYLPLPNERKDETDVQTLTLENVKRLKVGGEIWQQAAAV